MNRPKAALQAYQEARKVHPNRPNVKAALARLEDKVRGIQL
jgi:cytochrome c-type biogenesis protein CcmH/NrfG